MFNLFKLTHKSMATWTGLTKTEAAPLILDMLKEDAIKFDGDKHFYVYGSRRDHNMEYKNSMAENLCQLFKSEGIKVWLSKLERFSEFAGAGVEGKIIFPEEARKDLVINKLERLLPEDNIEVRRYFENKIKEQKNTLQVENWAQEIIIDRQEETISTIEKSINSLTSKRK